MKLISSGPVWVNPWDVRSQATHHTSLTFKLDRDDIVTTGQLVELALKVPGIASVLYSNPWEASFKADGILTKEEVARVAADLQALVDAQLQLRPSWLRWLCALLRGTPRAAC